MTFATAVPILSSNFVYRTNVYWSVIHGIKRKPHLSVVWNWYHFVAIAILHQPRPTDSADTNTRLQLSDTSSIPPMHGGLLLVHASSSVYIRTMGRTGTTLQNIPARRRLKLHSEHWITDMLDWACGPLFLWNSIQVWGF